jgi:hypothetical protein
MTFAHSNGLGITFHSGAPGEQTCVACHSDFPLNSGPGKVTISFANSASTYTAGQTMRVTVSVSDPNQRRWGFEASPRLGSDSTKLAGSMTAADTNEQVTTDQGIQFATHTTAGTRNGTTGGVSFEFD